MAEPEASRVSERDAERARQVREAERLLEGGPARLGLGKGLFYGRFVADWVMPYPQVAPAETEAMRSAIGEVDAFVRDTLDPASIDREADIPRRVIDELARIGVLGMTAPAEYGGRGFSQMAYCRVLERIGGACASTSVFVNAHHSIGIRALLLFGTDEQKRRWLGPLVRGERLAAFALTEPEAGSDAANVQTTATPTPDGAAYILNGQKRYITNGSIADVLTVMARTPAPAPGRPGESAVTAFLVTPDMPGFAVTEARMSKLGIRGTTTSRLAFNDMRVPADHVLGPLGKGLRVALTVLDFGRTTFGACCTGAIKTCLRLTIEHANRRRQFGRTLGEFELVQKKIATMAADAYALEAMTQVTASLIDRGLEDYMLETAMLKVFATERLWLAVNDAFQVHGGAAYFTDLPLERMLRDARINQIGEGANDVLRSFIALVGMRGPGLELRDLLEAVKRPWSRRGTLWRLGDSRLADLVRRPDVPVRSDALRSSARSLSRSIGRFGRAVTRTLVRHGEEVLERQLVQERIADAAMDLFAAACVLSRLDAELQAGGVGVAQRSAAELFLRMSADRVRRNLSAPRDPIDAKLIATACDTLGHAAH